MAELKKETKSILYQYSGRGCFIDWNSAYGFCCDLGRFLDDKIPFLMEHGCNFGKENDDSVSVSSK